MSACKCGAVPVCMRNIENGPVTIYMAFDGIHGIQGRHNTTHNTQIHIHNHPTGKTPFLPPIPERSVLAVNGGRSANDSVPILIQC